MLKSFFAAADSGGATVDTRLLNPRLRAGETLRGEVVVSGGAVDQDIARIALLLLAEAERGGGERREALTLASLPVSGPCRIPAACQWRLPFQLTLPEDTPVNCHPALGGEPLVWIHTDLALNRPRDASGGDRLQVLPTRQAETVLRAFSSLGWELSGPARATGSPVCRQWFELRPRDAGWNWNGIALTFVSDGRGVSHAMVEIDAADGEHCLSLRMEPDWEDRDWELEIRARLGW
ncbi:sporulation protein [Chromobacterium violaceum]|uniref:sporulation protein n=1 Tax=Chromobacterium violaceum TaxID=536 RepID=UPI0015F8B5E7|nr:sporulation protein [Chromobacterium violaceum]MBA8733315.1 sporulation protein [Chromobacterium violaceum]